MNASSKLTRIVAIGALALAAAAAAPTFAQGHSGGGGHASSGGGGHAHYAGGGSHFVGGSRFVGGYHGGGYYGGRAGFYGRGCCWHGNYFHGGYWHGGFYGPRVGFGWFLPVLPAFYATYYWGGIPYYYANDAYYTWSPDYNGYVATDPPEGAPEAGGAAGAPDAAGGAPPPAGAAAGGETYNYPKNGQSEQQQQTDRYQCHQWAVGQSGYDPTHNSAPSAGGQQMNYHRALTACLEGRGYSVK